MTEHIDTSDGTWRAVTEKQYARSGQDGVTLLRRGVGTTYWVRVDPVPPLPTAPYTVIRVTGTPPEPAVWMLDHGAVWCNAAEHRFLVGRELRERITGFEVLAEPTPLVALHRERERVTRDVTERVRRETVDEVAEHLDGVYHRLAAADVRRVFGVATAYTKEPRA